MTSENKTDMAPVEFDSTEMLINVVNNDKHGFSSHILRIISNILMNLNSDEKKFEPPTLTEFIEAQDEKPFVNYQPDTSTNLERRFHLITMA